MGGAGMRDRYAIAMSSDVVVVLVTCPPDRAEALAAALVEGRHAACVNIVAKIRSVYRWKDEVQRDDEALLIIKTRASAFDALKQAVLQLHPYELPEVIAVSVERGHQPYLDWVHNNVSA
jgi:periplasmic divalent cation tolerance protein